MLYTPGHGPHANHWQESLGSLVLRASITSAVLPSQPCRARDGQDHVNPISPRRSSHTRHRASCTLQRQHAAKIGEHTHSHACFPCSCVGLPSQLSGLRWLLAAPFEAAPPAGTSAHPLPWGPLMRANTSSGPWGGRGVLGRSCSSPWLHWLCGLNGHSHPDDASSARALLPAWLPICKAARVSLVSLVSLGLVLQLHRACLHHIFAAAGAQRHILPPLQLTHTPACMAMSTRVSGGVQWGSGAVWQRGSEAQRQGGSGAVRQGTHAL